MKKLYFLFLIFIIPAVVVAQVHGDAFLYGQTNHAGIKVLFTAKSPTANTDSAYTDSSGYYSLILTGGLYQIEFSKQGYSTVSYSGGNSILVGVNDSLSDVTLQPGNIISVSGNQSGQWTSNNIYNVDG